jgi:anti-sigma B factor antagonist
MNITVDEMDDGKTVIIRGPKRIEAAGSGEFRSKMNEVVDRGHYCVVVDLGETEFMDSSGLGAIVSRISVARSRGGDVRLASVSEKVYKILEVTQLDKLLKCYDNVEQALKSFCD